MAPLHSCVATASPDSGRPRRLSTTSRGTDATPSTPPGSSDCWVRQPPIRTGQACRGRCPTARSGRRARARAAPAECAGGPPARACRPPRGCAASTAQHISTRQHRREPARHYAFNDVDCHFSPAAIQLVKDPWQYLALFPQVGGYPR